MQKKTTKKSNNYKKRGGGPAVKSCFMTKECQTREEMLRFVVSPENVIVFDLLEKLPGRGFWIDSNRELLTQAIQKNAFFKAVRGVVTIPTDIVDQVETSLRQRVLSLLSLCRKSKLLVFGYEAVKKALLEGNVILAFEASDASEKGQRKLMISQDNLPIYSFLSRPELGQIAGMEEVVHIALLKGTLTQKAAAAARRYILFCEKEQKG